MSNAPPSCPGRESLKHAQRILEQKPHKDDHALSHLTRCLGEFRERLIQADRRGSHPEDRQRLSHLNAIISIVMAMHFPIGQAPWTEYEKACNWLEEIVRATEGLDTETLDAKA